MKQVPLWLLQSADFSDVLAPSKPNRIRDNMQTQTHTSAQTLDQEKPVTIMTVQQAAVYLGLAVSTLNKWRCHGGGPVFIKMGRAVRYRVEDLEGFVCSRQMTSTSF